MSCVRHAVYSTVIHCTGTQTITKDAITLASGEAFDIYIMVKLARMKSNLFKLQLL